MILSYQQLPAHLSRALGDLYLITGSEPALMDNLTTQIVDAFKAQHKASGSLIEKNTIWLDEPGAMLNLAKLLSPNLLFPSRQIVVVKYKGAALDKQTLAFIQQYIESPSLDHILIVEALQTKAKALNARFQKTLSAHLIDIPVFKLPEWTQWIASYLKAQAIAYEEAALRALAMLTQGQPTEAIQCIAQLRLLLPQNEPLTLATLNQVLSDVAQFPIYAFCESCTQGNTALMLRQLERLKTANTEPVYFLWWLSKLVRQLCTLQAQIATQGNIDACCKLLGIWPSQKQAFLGACHRIAPDHLKQMLYRCAELDVLLKSSPPRNIWDEFEALGLALCGSRITLFND